ncbi:MAG TPA: glycosyltransferase family 2 protein [Candidatus Acidoferrum sp.]|nr:glycosyltransferase family 2 protein [Candidatus Acidoferrum sp.]
MHFFGIGLFGLIALFWVTYGLRVAYGAIHLPWVRDFPPAPDAECPRISILFAARDEEEKLPAALATLMEINYPGLEVVAVDDRSQDATARILDEFAKTHSRLRVVHVDRLPECWLGKPHGLQKAYEASSGEWLLFTDADVRFKPDVLRRVVSLVRARNLDHLALLGEVETVGFWERVLITFFGLGFHLAANPSQVSNPRSSRYVGVGAFQLLRRSAYETSGTHRRLAMEVVDDMKLGKIVKEAGFRSGCAVAEDFVRVRWHAGLGNLVRGVTKNFFAGAGYDLRIVTAQLAGLLMMNILPFAGVVLGHGWIRALSAIAVVIVLSFHVGVAWVMRVSPLYALTHPLGAALFFYMLLRSTVVTLWQGGIVWRDTFYPLEELKRGVV